MDKYGDMRYLMKVVYWLAIMGIVGFIGYIGWEIFLIVYEGMQE